MARLRTPDGHILTLPPRRVSVGESAANEVPVAGGHGLAGVHFRLQPWESGHFLEDAGSGLNTLVNGRAVSWVPLKHGDVITAGELQMVYEADGTLPPPAGSPASGAVAEPFPVTGAVPLVEAVPEFLPPALPPVTERRTAPGESPASAAEPERKPPAWLPPEALLPPAPPPAWRPAPVRRRPGKKSVLLLLLLLAGAVIAWVFSRFRPR